jgi:hypothetical protein
MFVLSCFFVFLLDLQDIDQQAIITTAIHLISLPSKPIRNLPTLSQIRSYRIGLYALQWQLQSRYTQKKLALQRLKEERKLMEYEEMYSITRETLEKLKRRKLEQLQKEKEYHIYLQTIENEKRKQRIAAQVLQDLHNKRQTEEREKREKDWRIIDAIEKEKKFIEETIQQQLAKELEQMKYEDSLSQKYEETLQTILFQKKIIKKEFSKIFLMKKMNFSITKTLFSLSSQCKKNLTYSFLYEKVEKQFIMIYDHIYQFIHYLPFHKSFLEKILKKLNELQLPSFLSTSSSSDFSTSLNSSSFSTSHNNVIVSSGDYSSLPSFHHFFIERHLSFLLSFYQFNYDLLYEI